MVCRQLIAPQRMGVPAQDGQIQGTLGAVSTALVYNFREEMRT